MTAGVYWFYQASQDRAVYVGSSKSLEKRMQGHLRELKSGKHPNKHLQAVWFKYGADDISLSVLEETPEDKRIEREQFWLDAMPVWPTCNVAKVVDAPSVGRDWITTQEVRRKQSAALKGHKRTPEEIAKSVAARTGAKRTPEMRQRMSAGHKDKGSKRTPEVIQKWREKMVGKWVDNRGRECTAETRAKISKANSGRSPSAETRRKLSEATRASWAKRRENKEKN